MELMLEQPQGQQTLAHLLSVHPVLSSVGVAENLELVSLSAQTHPSVPQRKSPSSASAPTAAAPASSSAAQPPRVTIQTAQLLNLVEILCSARSGGGVRNTRQSHLNPLSEELLEPLHSFAIEALHLSHMSCVDAPLMRALVRLPALSSIELSGCRMLTDAGVAALIHPLTGLKSLRVLDVSDNAQLKGEWMPKLENMDDESRLEPWGPSTITSLNISGCRHLSARAFPFATRFLASLHELHASHTSGSFLAALLSSLHRCAELRTLDISGHTWTASAAATAVIRSGRLLLEGEDEAAALSSGVEMLTSRGEELGVMDAVQPRQSLERCIVDLPPLPHLRSIDVSSTGNLPDSMLAFILLHCTLGVLTSLSLSGCTELHAEALSWIADRAGTSLLHLDIDDTRLEDEQLRAELRLPAEDLQYPSAASSSADASSVSTPLAFPRLTSLLACHWTASLPSLCALLRCCPSLSHLDLSRLCPDEQSEAVQRQLAHAAAWQRHLTREAAAAAAAADREAIRQHALANGLPLPEEVASSVSVPQSPAAPAERTELGAQFTSSLTSLPSLSSVALREVAALCDSDLAQWAIAMPEEQQRSLHSLDVSRSERVGTEGVCSMLQAASPALHIQALECPLVQSEQLPAELASRVTASAAFDF
jgi:hypothetical protein